MALIYIYVLYGLLSKAALRLQIGWLLERYTPLLYIRPRTLN